MQVNSKSLYLIFGITVVFLFVFGCTFAPKSSISGKILIGNESAQVTSSKTIPEISIKKYQDENKKIASEPDFVPGEIIVKYRAGVAAPNVTKSLSGSGFSASRSLRRYENGTVTLLKLDNSEKSLASAGFVKDRTLLEIERLNSLSTVEYAEPNYIYRGLFLPNDVDYFNQWHYPLIKLEKMWADTAFSSLNDLSDITIALLDTGIGKNSGGNYHADLTGIFRDQYDFITNTTVSKDGNGRDSDATDPPAADTGFHGTHVAGTLGAITNNGTGVAGVGGGDGLGVRIMPVRILGFPNGTGYATDIAQGILYAAGLKTEDWPSLPTVPKADVINMSFGSGGNSSYIRDAVNEAYNAGVTLVAAAGNESTSSQVYPAAYQKVISVSAVSVGAERAYYSNYGETIDITAPGGDYRFDLDFDGNIDGVYSTIITAGGEDGYVYYQGTSMSSPHVAGAAAIVIKGLRLNGEISDIPANVKNILTTTSTDLGFPQFYGAGLLNVYAAAAAALDQQHGPDLNPYPKTIRLEAMNTTGSFYLTNIGDSGSFNINSIVEKYDETWDIILPSGISPTSGTVDTENSLLVQVSLDINGRQDGKTYYALLEITYDGTKKEYVNVSYKYIGDVYVVVLDSDTQDIVAMDVTNYEKGYEYKIDNLAAGKYIIGASTDRNGDGLIFDSNEAYGFYPQSGYETILDLSTSRNISGIDFILVDDML